ncbi:3-deoxy-7-phosphoheptulonate synthase [Hyalangium versicolor]|uniref:3-deoxy-7-phosphoheptulonate synthase n=1 Tax=Hyalangium versicolor TaxID=2861190 RepID=UPI001CCFA0BB|nr:3-deoxy-7-phosphoheptulonate synthase [Hyalangium versicolor]
MGGRGTDQGVQGASKTGPNRARREVRPEGTRITVGRVEIGGPGFVVMAGPCAVEDAEQTEQSAAAVAAAGAHVLRGGAFKPRTSPYAFQGLGEPGLHLLAEAGRRHGLPLISEVMDTAQIPLLMEYSDILQVGARNMQNFSLLRALGKVRKPVLVKRGLAATIEEWLLAAEYVLDGGNEQVLLCERGIRTFETAMRNTLDLAAVTYVKQRSHLPVIVDPSHATGHPGLVVPMSLAAAAAGADGLLVEVHPWPERALCDGAQALTPERFQDLMNRLPAVLGAVDRFLWKDSPVPAVGTR